MSVRVGFIGTGNIARSHIDALSKVEGAELVAFCDLVLEKAQQAAEPFQARAYADLNRMLDAERLDAVYICLAPMSHGDAEVAVAERGLPMFIEKPVANSNEVAARVQAAVEKAGVLVSVGYMNRYRRSIQRARELLSTDPPFLAYGGWLGGAPRLQWWLDKAQSGGQIVEQSTHTADLLRYLLGEAVEVHAFGTRGFIGEIPGFRYDTEDASVVNVRFAGGAVATLLSSCAVGVGGGVWLNVYARSLEVKCTGWEHTAQIRKSALETEEIRGEPDIFAIEDRAFIQAVQTGNRSLVLCDYADGARSLALTLAANESMRVGQPVRL